MTVSALEKLILWLEDNTLNRTQGQPPFTRKSEPPSSRAAASMTVRRVPGTGPSQAGPGSRRNGGGPGATRAGPRDRGACARYAGHGALGREPGAHGGRGGGSGHLCPGRRHGHLCSLPVPVCEQGRAGTSPGVRCCCCCAETRQERRARPGTLVAGQDFVWNGTEGRGRAPARPRSRELCQAPSLRGGVAPRGGREGTAMVKSLRRGRRRQTPTDSLAPPQTPPLLGK